MAHEFNFNAGWWLILAAFVSGAVIGLGFHGEEFLGGYSSFRRRLLRLGHIALAALGMLHYETINPENRTVTINPTPNQLRGEDYVTP